VRVERTKTMNTSTCFPTSERTSQIRKRGKMCNLRGSLRSLYLVAGNGRQSRKENEYAQ